MSVPGLSKKDPGYDPHLTGRIPFASDEERARLQVIVRMGHATGIALGSKGETVATLTQIPGDDLFYLFRVVPDPTCKLMYSVVITHIVLEGVLIPVEPHLQFWVTSATTLSIAKQTFHDYRRF